MFPLKVSGNFSPYCPITGFSYVPVQFCSIDPKYLASIMRNIALQKDIMHGVQNRSFFKSSDKLWSLSSNVFFYIFNVLVREISIITSWQFTSWSCANFNSIARNVCQNPALVIMSAILPFSPLPPAPFLFNHFLVGPRFHRNFVPKWTCSHTVYEFSPDS